MINGNNDKLLEIKAKLNAILGLLVDLHLKHAPTVAIIDCNECQYAEIQRHIEAASKAAHLN